MTNRNTREKIDMKLRFKQSPTRSTLFMPLLLLGICVSCSNPQPGPDKTVAGTVLGASWGAGAGAVVGNQVDSTGKGIAVGAGFGAVAGMLAGGGLDMGEGALLKQERELTALQIRNIGTQLELEKIQGHLDRAALSDASIGVYQVFFDEDATSLRAGAVANLETLAEAIKTNPHVMTVNVVGHTDDTGVPDYNDRLALARANTVSAYLGTRGISMGSIKTSGQGASQPIASNASQAGRQLNRRVDVFVSR
jgi:outer membrane protein OmpA-like peptidoglycan-associated protein